MPGKRELLSKLLVGSGISRLGLAYKKSFLLIVNYHRIFKNSLNTQFDKGVYSHEADQFRDQLKWLKRNFRIISERDLIQSMEGGVSLPARSAMITFDDGYKDTYDLVFPILKELEVPALYFIPYQMIDDQRLGWWDLISYCVNTTSKSSIRLFGQQLNLDSVDNKNSAILKIKRFIKDNDYTKTASILDDLSSLTEVDFPDEKVQAKELLSWEEIRELSNNNIAIGSHTLNHPVLSRISLKEQEYEISQSKIEIENKVGKPVHSFSYPVGGKLAFTDETKKLVENAGYKLGFSFYGGFNYYNSMDKLDLKRLEFSTQNHLYRCQAFSEFFH